MEKQELKNLYRDAVVESVGDLAAETLSEMAAELTIQMKYRDVEFSFMKKDGTLRHAVGTTNPDVLPPKENGEEYDASKPKNYAVINFWDCEKEAWRCCKTASLVSVEV